jgi:hypothetical protein
MIMVTVIDDVAALDEQARQEGEDGPSGADRGWW